METVKEKLCRFCMYGIWTVAVLLFVNFFLLVRHDYKMKYDVEKKIEANSIQIQRNTERVDSLTKQEGARWSIEDSLHHSDKTR